jgi:hypothetical protein
MAPPAEKERILVVDDAPDVDVVPNRFSPPG